jgi:hypothetical protein
LDAGSRFPGRMKERIKESASAHMRQDPSALCGQPKQLSNPLARIGILLNRWSDLHTPVRLRVFGYFFVKIGKSVLCAALCPVRLPLAAMAARRSRTMRANRRSFSPFCSKWFDVQQPASDESSDRFAGHFHL